MESRHFRTCRIYFFCPVLKCLVLVLDPRFTRAADILMNAITWHVTFQSVAYRVSRNSTKRCTGKVVRVLIAGLSAMVFVRVRRLSCIVLTGPKASFGAKLVSIKILNSFWQIPANTAELQFTSQFESQHELQSTNGDSSSQKYIHTGTLNKQFSCNFLIKALYNKTS